VVVVGGRDGFVVGGGVVGGEADTVVGAAELVVLVVAGAETGGAGSAADPPHADITAARAPATAKPTAWRAARRSSTPLTLPHGARG
jgi:hypothetical protein